MTKVDEAGMTKVVEAGMTVDDVGMTSHSLNQPPAVTIQLASYDSTKPLIIDPVLFFSTFLGGSSNEGDAAVAVDAAGQTYMTGLTFSVDFPTCGATGGPGTNPCATDGASIDSALGLNLDAFVTKLNAAGTALIYSTYLGGSGGNGDAGERDCR